MLYFLLDTGLILLTWRRSCQPWPHLWVFISSIQNLHFHTLASFYLPGGEVVNHDHILLAFDFNSLFSSCTPNLHQTCIFSLCFDAKNCPTLYLGRHGSCQGCVGQVSSWVWQRLQTNIFWSSLCCLTTLDSLPKCPGQSTMIDLLAIPLFMSRSVLDHIKEWTTNQSY
jgi:hypothetical protein